ncbi:YhgE/Pip family protein [Gordonia sp. (in: high G+C Gram-positive bacteria)]|uniref:YhgE/Pip family protein n=1 Tax=Gordonia sp. (in: high G+C Gram-positive bacteria) TaxID=84139 RepID=UPI003C789640
MTDTTPMSDGADFPSDTLSDESAATSAPTPSRMSGWYRTRLRRLFLALVVVVPLVFSAVYMWFIWDPTDTVDKMPVAIVNNDQPFGTGADRLAAGEGVQKELVDSQALDFSVVDAATAEAGLKHGDYYFIIEIPQDFSADLSQIGSATTAPALINVTYNDNNTLMASNIGGQAMASINQAVLEGVSATTVGTLLDGVNSLSSGLKEASDGSAQLYGGTSELSAGATQLSDGLNNELLPGMTEAANGGHELANGAVQLASGAGELQAGTAELGAGATELADGIGSLTDTIDIASLKATLDRLQKTPGIGSELGEITAIVQGLSDLKSGSRELARQLSDPNAEYRSGVDQLTAGAGELSAGSNELASGLDQLQSGTAEAGSGAKELAAGAKQLDDGAKQLSDGLGAGAKEAPDLSDATQRTSLAALLSTPVTSEASNVAQARGFGPGAAPVILAILPAIIALAVLMTIRVRGRDVTTGNRRSARMWWRRASKVVAFSIIALAVLMPILWLLLTPSPSPASLLQVVVIVVAATIMNASMIALLFTWLGYTAGAVATLAWTMLQLFAYGGVWMVETVPTPLQWLHPIAPMTYIREGLIAGFNGASGFWSSLLVLLVITAITTALTLWIRSRGSARYPVAPIPGGAVVEPTLDDPDLGRADTDLIPVVT